VQEGLLPVPGAVPGQYVRILGSAYSDGLHRCPLEGLPDQEFLGELWLLAVPQAVQDLAEEVKSWQEQYGAPAPYQSESFGGYSYNRGDGPKNWMEAFGPRLAPWRKL
jgi:hypothetical protein